MAANSKRTEGKKGGQRIEETTGSTQTPDKGLSYTALRVLELSAAPPTREKDENGREHYKPRLSNREIAHVAGCHPSYVQQLKKDPRWLQAYYSLLGRRIQAYIPELIEVAMESARLPGRDGHHDRKMLMNMAGIATQGVQRHEHQHSHQHSASDRLQRALERSRERGNQILDASQAPPQDDSRADEAPGQNEQPAEQATYDEADPLDPDSY
jgi:hypothetical protein